MHHKSLKLEYLRIVEIDFWSGRYIESLAVDNTDYTQIINGIECVGKKYSVSKSKESFSFIPAELSDTFCRIGLWVQVFLYTVEFVYLGQPYIIAQWADLLLEVAQWAEFWLLQFYYPAYIVHIPHTEDSGSVYLILDME